MKKDTFSNGEILEKFGLTPLIERRAGSNLMEILKIINGMSFYDRHFKNISP